MPFLSVHLSNVNDEVQHFIAQQKSQFVIQAIHVGISIAMANSICYVVTRHTEERANLLGFDERIVAFIPLDTDGAVHNFYYPKDSVKTKYSAPRNDRRYRNNNSLHFRKAK